MEARRPNRPTRAWLRKQGMESDIADETSSEFADDEQDDTTDEDKKVPELSTRYEPKFENEGIAPRGEKTPPTDAPPPTTTSTRVDPEPAAMESSGSGVQGDSPPPQSGTPSPNDQHS
eukprot:10033130-Karenia_brevis.AAC.1